MGMGFAPTWLRQVSHPLLHVTMHSTLTTARATRFLHNRTESIVIANVRIEQTVSLQLGLQ